MYCVVHFGFATASGKAGTHFVKPVKLLPQGYMPVTSLDLSRNRRAFWSVQVVGTLLFFAFGWAFLRFGILLRREAFTQSITLAGILGLVVAMFVVIVIHEVVHGVVFWVCTRELPRFGFKGVYAYTAAPSWFLPRRQHLTAALAPFVLITAIGMALTPFIPAGALLIWLFGLTVNAAGAVGDFFVAALSLSQPADVLVNDYGDGITLYSVPRKSS